MLIYTEEGRKAVLDCLSEAVEWGEYSEHFRLMLHRILSTLNLRTDRVELRCGSYKIKPIQEEKTVEFECFFNLTWLNDKGEGYMHGGLVWSESSQSFGVHT